MTSSHTPPRLSYLDALRGLAILSVLAFHTTSYGTNIYPVWFAAVISQGARGVQLFFVVSAITLCLSLSSRREEPQALRNFLIRRFFRIAPLFYVAVVYFLVQSWLSRGQLFSFANIFTTVTFTNGWSPYWINNIIVGGWTLPIETSFYLLLPSFFLLTNSIKKVTGLLCIGVVLGQLIRLLFLNTPGMADLKVWSEFTFLFLPSQLPVFFFGIWAYVLLFRLPKKEKWQQLCGVTAICLMIAVIQLKFPFKLLAGHYLWALGFVWLAVGLAHAPIKLIVNGFTTALGKISYSVYLCHFAVMFWLSRAQLVDLAVQWPLFNYALRLGLVLIFSVFTAAFLYVGIERPGQALGRKVITVLSDQEKRYKP